MRAGSSRDQRGLRGAHLDVERTHFAGAHGLHADHVRAHARGQLQRRGADRFVAVEHARARRSGDLEEPALVRCDGASVQLSRRARGRRRFRRRWRTGGGRTRRGRRGQCLDRGRRLRLRGLRLADTERFERLGMLLRMRIPDGQDDDQRPHEDQERDPPQRRQVRGLVRVAVRPRRRSRDRPIGVHVPLDHDVRTHESRRESRPTKRRRLGRSVSGRGRDLHFKSTSRLRRVRGSVRQPPTPRRKWSARSSSPAKQR